MRGCVERGNPRHAKIFEQAFRKSNGFVSDGPVDFRYSQAAQIIRDYKPREAPSKMVDFCVIYKPERGSPVERAIEEICQTRPAQSINHTDLGDLCKRPIVLSIETKRPNIDRDNATLQMGTWQSAQWRSLQHKRSPSFRPIDFLPGIIVQGHDWQFVASILDENDKPVLLKGVQLGGTDSELRIYSLILGLRRLKRWIMEDYWPAFVSDVLAIPWHG
ncbi:Transposase [Fusarium oxysporum f. sp. albedinis]|nr:Transposase [Fusarium oxysporum f. sp. albedinis]